MQKSYTGSSFAVIFNFSVCQIIPVGSMRDALIPSKWLPGTGTSIEKLNLTSAMALWLEHPLSSWKIWVHSLVK